MRRSAVAREAAMWLIAAFLAYIFLRQGFSKFSADSGWAKAFRGWHYPAWFRVLIGVTEIGGALLLFVRSLAFLGALMIVVVMLGGMATHLWWGHPHQMTNEVLPLVLGAITAAVRFRDFAAIRPGR